MLYPLVKIVGIPAMKKLAEEIFEWTNKTCFKHLVTYATVPPHLPKSFDNSHGMRFWKSQVLRALGKKYDVCQWKKAAALFEESGKLIIELCKTAMVQDKNPFSTLMLKVADIEEEAYKYLE